MKKIINNFITWSKPTGKLTYIGLAVETFIALIVASVITWNKTYNQNDSMFQFQIPILFSGGFISICSIDAMSLFGKPFERRIMKIIISDNPLFYLKRYGVFGVVFSILGMILGSITLSNANVMINIDFFAQFFLVALIVTIFFSTISTISVIIKKQWQYRILLLLVLFQGFVSTLSFYPYFMVGVNPYLCNSIGIIFPMISIISLMGSFVSGISISVIIPCAVLLLTYAATILKVRKARWNINILL